MAVAECCHLIADRDVIIAKACPPATAWGRENDIPHLAFCLNGETVVGITEMFLGDSAGQRDVPICVPGPTVVSYCSTGEHYSENTDCECQSLTEKAHRATPFD